MGKVKNCIYALKPLGKHPNGEIETVSPTTISIAIYPAKGVDGFKFIVERKFARLLAKRINQCLDDTLSKGGK